jgi:hypothetical protein
MYLIGMLVLLFLANIAMLMGMTNWPQRTREMFANAVVSGKQKGGSASPTMVFEDTLGNNSLTQGASFQTMYGVEGFKAGGGGGGLIQGKKRMMEGFRSTINSKFEAPPMGPYDNLDLRVDIPPAGQQFRQNHPNVPLAGPPITIDDNHLLLFTNNQCKPECCGATLSCDGGCVCTTPEQRTFINTRGGNRGPGGADF